MVQQRWWCTDCKHYCDDEGCIDAMIYPFYVPPRLDDSPLRLDVWCKSCNADGVTIEMKVETT